MKKTMLAVGISLAVGMAGCSVTKNEEKTLSAVQESVEQGIEKENGEFGAFNLSDMKQEYSKPNLEIPDLHLHETLFKTVSGMHEDFLQAGMTQKDGTYTYGDITIDSVKETHENISFAITFKEPLDDNTRNHVVNWFYLRTPAAPFADNLTFDVVNNEEKRQMSWKVTKYEKVGKEEKTKKVIVSSKKI